MDLKRQALVHRYAQDFVQKANQSGRLTVNYEAVSGLIDVFEETKLDAVLTSDKFDKPEKVRLIRQLRQTSDSLELSQLLDSLIADEDLGLILPILKEILVKIGDETQIYDMEVVVSTPLTPEQRSRLRDIVETKFLIKTHHLIETLDPSIIGGFIIKVNNQIIDASVRSQLQEVKQKL